MKPKIRLASRSVLMGVTTMLVQLQGQASWDHALIRSAIVSAVLASMEVLTPMNGQVGINKST